MSGFGGARRDSLRAPLVLTVLRSRSMPPDPHVLVLGYQSVGMSGSARSWPIGRAILE